MPELPDVEIFRKEAEKSKNSEITGFEIGDKDFVELTQQKFKSNLKGKKIRETVRRGKYLFLKVDEDAGVMMHFGMTGFLEYKKENEEKPDYTKCSFVLKNGHKLHYISKRKLGHVKYVGETEDFIEKKEIGPDALELNEPDFISKLSKKNSMIKSALMDQSVVSGIGNVYADEILFQSKIHPKQKANKLSGKNWKTLHKKTVKVLKKAIEKEADVSRLPKSYLLPNREEGNDCPRCDGKIEKIIVSGRTGYYCPSCQKK
jgi:formamidopyrimidine-DNA glycosylase